jgi:predicted transcriptional regulator
MTIVSSKEFATHQKKYYDMAVNEDVFIKRGRKTFHLHYTAGRDTAGYDEVLEPDDDFRSAITGEELRKLLREDIREMFREKK